MSAGPLTELLACPVCRGDLSEAGDELTCAGCGARYTLRDGIPALVADESADPYKARQAAFFDEETSEEYEITRPSGTPAFHRWMIEEKFRRSVRALDGRLSEWTAVTVCGGSGMDAEFLARAGARVVTCDISSGAARRARERARRRGLPITSVVADAERLPFRDRSFDLVDVHDGLHHLERPDAALAEMARVARAAVSVTEPARAAATALAMRLRLAQGHEEAGNRVRRLTLDEVVEQLRSYGFEVVAAERYAMLYRHEPGRPSRALSSRPLFPLAKAGLTAFNRVGGRIGNKLTVQAMRP